MKPGYTVLIFVILAGFAVLMFFYWLQILACLAGLGLLWLAYQFLNTGATPSKKRSS